MLPSKGTIEEGCAKDEYPITMLIKNENNILTIRDIHQFTGKYLYAVQH